MIPLVLALLGPGDGLQLETDDGRSALQLEARIQPRLEHEQSEAEAPRTEIEIRRARVKLSGHAFGVHNRFYLQLGFSPKDMEGGIVSEDIEPRRSPLRDARIEFDYLRDATVWIGQMKVPYSHERWVSDGDLGMIDRSLVNQEFNLDRDIGMQLRSDDLGGVGSRLGYALGVFGGEGRNTLDASTPRLLYVARFEVRPLGGFEDGEEADLARNRQPALRFGGAYAFHDDARGDRGVHGHRPVDGGTTDIHEATADATFKWHGVSVEAAVAWRHGWRTRGSLPEPTVAARNGIGGYVQVGALLPGIDLELVSRYALVRPSTTRATSLERGDEVGGGINYYVHGHKLKVQADYTHAWVPGDRATLYGSDMIRVQFQIAI